MRRTLWRTFTGGLPILWETARKVHAAYALLMWVSLAGLNIKNIGISWGFRGDFVGIS
jgi:hypothetical protein